MSRLVILHEEAEDGNAMPDLNKPVQAVSYAVNNLVKVNSWIIKHTILLIRRDTYTLRHHHQQTKFELTISKTKHMLARFFRKFFRIFCAVNSYGNSSKVDCFDAIFMYEGSCIIEAFSSQRLFFAINGKLPRYFRGLLESRHVPNNAVKTSK